MRWLLVVATALLPAPALQPDAGGWAVASPDAHTEIRVTRRADGALQYRVTRDGQIVLGDSPMGIRRADAAFDTRLTYAAASAPRAVDDSYTLPHGKRKEHHVSARERTLTFTNGAGGKLELVLRAQNDGIAFRYRFPETAAGARTVVEELTGFTVPEGSTGWMLPRQPVEKYAPAYEDLYQQVTSGAAAPRADGWDFPALFKTPSGTWALVTESALDGTYCGSHLAQNSAGGTYTLAFPDPGEGRGVGKARPESSLPWTLPWRVVIVGDEAGRILESDLVTDLSPPSAIGPAAWVKPGRAAWSWWSMSDSPKHAGQLNAFTDLAAEMGWEYALVDANWNAMQTGTIDDVIKHAREKNVGLLFWYNSGGPHNDVTEAPRDRMTTHEQRVKEFTQLKAWGVKGVKVDFWQSDKQDRIAQYRDLLKDAADFQLMVDFHGSTIPRGWQREFPNLIGMEAVAGAEQYKFREDYAAKAPWLNTVLPFTRNVAGPMDYTPVTFSDAKYPHVTTNAHELALSVVFDSPIQHFADSADSYRAQPPEVRAFLSGVPAAWDETHVLSGEPGKTLVIARRAGAVWYIAGLNGTESPATVKVAVPFLGEGGWNVTSLTDAPGGRRTSAAGSLGGVTASATAEMAMSPRGGFVMRLDRPSARGLDVYFIDVEGGQATLLVAPSGQSMLIDTGYPGNDDRDADRILAVAQQAGISRLDYLLVTHYHNDHVGNAPALAARIPIRTFIDHGESVETDDAAKALYAAYAKVREAGSHIQAKPGDRIPIGELDLTIVTSGGARIGRPLVTPPQANSGCAGFTPKAVDTSENARSVGSVIAFGRFRLVDFGDLTWNKEQELVCPDNLLGTVDVYLTTHHGLDQSNAPVLVHALRPRVAIMNNAPKKGGEPQAMRTVRSSPGLVDFWQLHTSLNAPDANMPPAMIANLDESTAHYIKLSAQRDGSFTVTNTRTGETRRYPAR